MRKIATRVVLFVPMSDTDIGITALLLKLQSSNSRHNIAVNWLTCRVQLQNKATCLVETSTSISLYNSNGDIEVGVSTEPPSYLGFT